MITMWDTLCLMGIVQQKPVLCIAITLISKQKGLLAKRAAGDLCGSSRDYEGR